MKEFIKKILYFLHLTSRFLRARAKQAPFLTKSLILHFILIIIMSGLIPTCSTKIEKPKIIEVQIITQPMSAELKPKPKPKPAPIKKITPPKKKEVKKELPKPKPKKKEKPKPKPVAKKKKEVKKAPKISEVPTLKKEKIKKKPEKEEPKKKDDKKDKKQEAKEVQEGKKALLKDLEKKEDIDDIFEKIDKELPKEKEKLVVPKIKKKEEPKQEAEFVPDARFAREISKIVQGQIAQYWSIPIGVKDVQNMAVKLYIKLDKKGNIKQVRILDKKRYESDNSYRVLADSAVRAVKECSIIQGLPADKHQYWSELEMNFDPASVL